MNSQDPFELWKEERRDVGASGALADRVMRAVRARSSVAPAARPAPIAASFVRLAAVAVLAVAIQVMWFWTVLLALPGTAN
jgi:hypothetical protein